MVPSAERRPRRRGRRLGRDAADAQDRDLGVVDDRRLEEPGELARARDRERRASKLVGCERSGASPLGERRDLRAELVDGLLVRAADDRDDETVVRLHCDADVVAVEVDDRVAVEAGVQLGELGERVGACLHDRREHAVERDALEVALLDPCDRRHLAMRARHVLGDHAANAAERLAATLRCRPRRPRARRPP